jgi:DNA-binding transcriptional MerR regulator
VLLRARQAGFTLGEIRQLFYGFRGNVSPSARWKALSRKKLAELGALMRDIRTMQRLLHRLKSCRCDALEECGRRILARGLTGYAGQALKKLPKQG